MSWNQEASIVVRDDLDGISLGNIANTVRPNFDLCFGSAGGKLRGVLYGMTATLMQRYERCKMQRYERCRA